MINKTLRIFGIKWNFLNLVGSSDAKYTANIILYGKKLEADFEVYIQIQKI